MYKRQLANSNYEEWRKANKTSPCGDFPFALSKMSKGGALFDMAKLNDISKTYISTLSADTVYDNVYVWAEKYDKELFERLQDKEYAMKVFSVERGNAKPRKDIAKWDEVKDYTEYYFTAPQNREYPDNIGVDEVIKILNGYMEMYTPELSAEDWFPKLRDMAEEMGYAKTPKLYKASPEEFKGHVGDVSTVVRVAVTGRTNTPDLFWISSVIGYDEALRRITSAINLSLIHI